MSARQIDLILDDYQDRIGTADFRRYRNHCHRVYELALRFYKIQTDKTQSDTQALAIAAAFHDLGIWTHRTFDYLDPSVDLAQSYLQANDLLALKPLVTDLIQHHHQFRSHPHPWVDAFRRADWCDVSACLWSNAPGRELLRRFPLHGFHSMLTREFVKHAARHPLNPLPMMKW